MTTLDRSSPLPLWAQICEDLRTRIGDKEFEDRFPAEETLSRMYGVSRQTIRQSIRSLEMEGLIVRERGRGTRLARGSMVEQPLHSLYSVASTVSAQGFIERSEVVACRREAMTPEVRSQLGDLDDDVIYIERIRFAGEEPIGWDRSWLPWAKASNLIDADLSRGGLYDALTLHCGLTITGGSEKIQPIIPTSFERARLSISKEVGVFLINRLAKSGNEIVEWRRSLVRGDRFVLVANWPGSIPPS
ncbi:MAG: GntR family transcriptional regulator [Actinomycetota bacterium]|nr:GntR family transcriptional regulator [Actinomycetota bacterium]